MNSEVSFGSIDGATFSRQSADNLLNLLKGEETSSIGGGFYAKYEPKEVLGRGLSSTVRKCICRETSVEYAVKIIDKSQDVSITDAVTAEIDILQYLPKHKNITLFFFFGGTIMHTRDVYKLLQLIKTKILDTPRASGGELFDYLTQMVKLSEKKTRSIMYQVFVAVELMHSNKVVHRDLKPENILLDESQKIVKISDFGFSTLLPDAGLSELLGTPGYLAPEMIKRSVEMDALPYNEAVDLWACGVIMYTLLVGFPPFWHRKQLILLRNIMEGRYEFVSPEWDDISDSAKDLVRKLLVVDPNNRITATNALDHPFIQTQPVEFKVFSPRRRFKAAVYCVMSCHSLEKLRKTPKTVTLKDLYIPYENKVVRAMIDSCAFHIYGHWVKRYEEQNRAALFETMPKRLSGMKSIFLT